MPPPVKFSNQTNKEANKQGDEEKSVSYRDAQSQQSNKRNFNGPEEFTTVLTSVVSSKQLEEQTSQNR